MNDPSEYLRNLPHIQPETGIFSITFRLHGSLPKESVLRLSEEYHAQQKQINPVNDKLKTHLQNDYFITFDESLNDKLGPMFLKEPEIGNLVSQAIHFRDNKEYNLICFCIMPNHVHLIIYKIQKPLFRILQSLKRFTAFEANKILRKQGSFWQKESYDHLIKSRKELADTISYILNNPVKAGLVSDWNEWGYTYCKPLFLDR